MVKSSYRETNFLPLPVKPHSTASFFKNNSTDTPVMLTHSTGNRHKTLFTQTHLLAGRESSITEAAREEASRRYQDEVANSSRNEVDLVRP